MFRFQSKFNLGKTVYVLNSRPSQSRYVARHFMTNLNSAILSFDDWPNPSSFYCIICNDKYLLTDELNLFKEIWLNASRFEFWNDGDLSVGLEKAKQFIKKNYTLTDKVIEVVVKAISYPWK